MVNALILGFCLAAIFTGAMLTFYGFVVFLDEVLGND